MAVSQVHNVGGFAVSACLDSQGLPGVASAAPTTTGTLTVTPLVAGICTFTITGSGKMTALLGVTVTTTIVNSH